MNRLRLLRSGCWLAGLMVLGLSSGCGGSAETPQFLKNLVPVTGTVTINGKPAAGAGVRFLPPSGSGTPLGVHSASGNTDAEGRYTLVTPTPHVSREQMQGALPGDYTVVITRLTKPDGSPVTDMSEADAMAEGASESLPPRYSDENTSKLKATVSASSGAIDFDLKIKSR